MVKFVTVVQEITQEYGLNFWVRCASGNVLYVYFVIVFCNNCLWMKKFFESISYVYISIFNMFHFKLSMAMLRRHDLTESTFLPSEYTL